VIPLKFIKIILARIKYALFEIPFFENPTTRLKLGLRKLLQISFNKQLRKPNI